MIQMTAIALTLLGSVLVYLSSKHQGLITKKLPGVFTLLGLCVLVGALLAWLQMLTTTAAIFIWLFTSTTILICIPFITLSKNRA
ncbi:hypothetical protein LZP69_09075 [Shewanella sp. AS1]|uniref:hypothetical protein n=1 Tax=Shewanella sp. AS1 TaxID=2907626 RepID=UPI001F1E7A1F|nr:hypothetical protein [Shewanella sp. AS1]MCE9679325.1 hypothetical protein [Shewanella sp. AS1]